MSPEGAFGVPYNKTTYFQLGAYFSGRYGVSLSKKMIYKTRLDLYANYLAKDTKDSTGKVVPAATFREQQGEFRNCSRRG